MATDTQVTNLIINKLSKSQYDNLETKSDTELYLVPDVQDAMPTQNSTNNVSSGGVYTAIQSRQQAITSSNKLSADLVQSGTTNKVYTATEQTKLSGIESGAQTNIIESISLNGTVQSISGKNVDLSGLATELFINNSISGLESSLDDIHETISSSLNDLNDRLLDITDEVDNMVIPSVELSNDYAPSSNSNTDLFLAPGDTFEEAFSKLEKSINDNEQITSAALNDLNEKVENIELKQDFYIDISRTYDNGPQYQFVDSTITPQYFSELDNKSSFFLLLDLSFFFFFLL